MININKIKAFYDPPYDSPLEDAFAFNIVKYLKDEIRLEKQYEVQTICGRFILDFLVESPQFGKIAFECDGKEFHEHSRDEWRDAMILGSTDINTIYRLRGSDLTYHIADVLFIISNHTPDIFSSRGVANLKQLASKEVLSRSYDLYDTIDLITFPSDDHQEMTRIFIERHHKNITAGKKQFWQAAYKFASAEGGGNLDDIINKYRSQKWE